MNESLWLSYISAPPEAAPTLEQEKTVEEPTTRDIAEKLRLVLDETAFTPEELDEMAGMETGEALGLAYKLLLENGMDPDEFFREQGIVEYVEPPLITRTAEVIAAIGHPELGRILTRYAEALANGNPDADTIISEAEGYRDQLSATPEGRETLKKLRAAIMAILESAP